MRNGDARALLSSAVRFKLDERIRDRIIAETRGNPLALLELPRGLTATELAGGFGLLGAQALTGRIEESFVRRLEALSTMRGVCCWSRRRSRSAIRCCSGVRADVSGSRRAAEEEEADELLAIGERVTFRHPLVRSAVYRSAAAEDRRAVHLALADATDRSADPTVVRGIWPRPRPGPTSRSRWSSSGPPAGRRRAAASPRRRRSCIAPSR